MIDIAAAIGAAAEDYPRPWIARRILEVAVTEALHDAVTRLDREYGAVSRIYADEDASRADDGPEATT